MHAKRLTYLTLLLCTSVGARWALTGTWRDYSLKSVRDLCRAPGRMVIRRCCEIPGLVTSYVPTYTRYIYHGDKIGHVVN
ncbi:hypothetical protein F5B17DRAFT_401695, partial [Nemania serpens]